MADRKTLINALIELECKPTTYARELLRKNWTEALATAEFDPCRRLDGRTASRELSVYDAMMAEILGEKFAEKCRHEKHRAGKEYRHRKPEDRHAHGERYSMNFAKVECGNDHVRNLYHEITMRNDWELEYAENEKARINAELDALNDWLVWA